MVVGKRVNGDADNRLGIPVEDRFLGENSHGQTRILNKIKEAVNNM